ncbi:MAG: hypothetical protein LBE82_09930 [Chitinophagaceae bacterium]|nr:hypothetical protein [Chitinophagaceae bacterium]
MNSIYVCHYQAADRFLEYKIGLKNKIFWKYSMEAHRNQPRNENEGYDFGTQLTDNKIVVFLSEATKAGFENWKEVYNMPIVAGGHWWDIDIAFSNGIIKKIHGCNGYPKTWNEMNLALKNLTGEENILLYNVSPNKWIKIYDGEDK